MTITLPQLASEPDAPFPPVHRALREPDGLLAMGGDLSPTRLINAYRCGIFPWFSENDPLLWWSPNPRIVFDTATFRLPSRFRRSLRHSDWTVRFDSDFDAVISACASAPRAGQSGTWISAPMQSAYRELHRLGYAHSVEVLAGNTLVGGLYGVAVGQMFFGESMFSHVSGGSKVALAALARQLAQWQWPWLDAQVANPHLMSLGAQTMPRTRFVQEVAKLANQPGHIGSWGAISTVLAASELAHELPAPSAR